MDWASITPAIVTGAVGVAGIVGTLTSARIARKSAAENLRVSIIAEDTRQRRAEKRQIYAVYIGSITPAVSANSRMNASRAASIMPFVKLYGTETVPYAAAQIEASQAITNMFNAKAELELVAPSRVIKSASKLHEAVIALMFGKQENDPDLDRQGIIALALQELQKTMRADLDNDSVST